MISQRQKRKIIARSQHHTYKRKTPSHKRPCKKCGRQFIKKHNRQIYCKKCRPIVQKEQHNEAQRKYYKKWKSTINRRKLLKPGTNELPKNIGETWEKEEEIIKKEKNRTYTPYRKMYSRHILGF